MPWRKTFEINRKNVYTESTEIVRSNWNPNFVLENFSKFKKLFFLTFQIYWIINYILQLSCLAKKLTMFCEIFQSIWKTFLRICCLQNKKNFASIYLKNSHQLWTNWLLETFHVSCLIKLGLVLLIKLEMKISVRNIKQFLQEFFQFNNFHEKLFIFAKNIIQTTENDFFAKLDSFSKICAKQQFLLGNKKKINSLCILVSNLRILIKNWTIYPIKKKNFSKFFPI